MSQCNQTSGSFRIGTMKKTTQPKKLVVNKTTLRVLTTKDLRDVVGGTEGGTWSLCTSKCSWQIECDTDVC